MTVFLLILNLGCVTVSITTNKIALTAQFRNQGLDSVFYE